MNKPKGSPVKKGGSGDTALNFVRNKIRKETGKPEGQQKKVKGEKKKESPNPRIQRAKDFSENIKKIEAYDVSHISGENGVASCVVFSKMGSNKKIEKWCKDEWEMIEG